MIFKFIQLILREYCKNIILDGVNGAAGGLDYSFDGTKLLYTYDISGNENWNTDN